jgi:hypothetical protein
MDKIVLREEKVPTDDPSVFWLTTYILFLQVFEMLLIHIDFAPCIEWSAQGGAAEVYTHGGHVTSWKDPSGKVSACHAIL